MVLTIGKCGIKMRWNAVGMVHIITTTINTLHKFEIITCFVLMELIPRHSYANRTTGFQPVFCMRNKLGFLLPRMHELKFVLGVICGDLSKKHSGIGGG
jgi:hypothetical protein